MFCFLPPPYLSYYDVSCYVVRTLIALDKMPCPCAESARHPTPPACSWVQPMEESVGEDRTGQEERELGCFRSWRSTFVTPLGLTPTLHGSWSPGLWKYCVLPLFPLMTVTSHLTARAQCFSSAHVLGMRPFIKSSQNLSWVCPTCPSEMLNRVCKQRAHATKFLFYL